MKAVILAAGEGQRLRPLTYTRPKHLIPIGGKSLLEHLLNALKEAGLKDALLVVHYKADMIKQCLGDGSDLGIRIEYVFQPKIMGTADAIGLAEDYVNEDFLVVYGDLLITSNVIRKVLNIHEKIRPAATLTSVFVKHPERYGVIKIEGSSVVGIIEKPPPEATLNNRINAGVYVFSTDIFKAIKRTAPSIRDEREITDSIRFLIDDERSVMAAQIPSEEWLDIGRPWDLLEANERLLKGIKTEINGSVEENAHLLGPVVVDEEACIRSGAYIEGPVYIGGGSEIGPNCYIRSCTSIGRNVRIGNACEVKNSLVMNGAHIGHLSYLGDSVIGESCNLGAGSISANLRFDDETIKMNIKGEIVDSERRKIGVIMGDNVKTGIGALFMPGVKIGCNSWIGPNLAVYRDVPPDTILILEQTTTQRKR